MNAPSGGSRRQNSRITRSTRATWCIAAKFTTRSTPGKSNDAVLVSTQWYSMSRPSVAADARAVASSGSEMSSPMALATTPLRTSSRSTQPLPQLSAMAFWNGRPFHSSSFWPHD